jgi:hypothetical protein
MVTAQTDWVALARELGGRFAARAAAHDAGDSFVAENYAELKAHRAFYAGSPPSRSCSSAPAGPTGFTARAARSG